MAVAEPVDSASPAAGEAGAGYGAVSARQSQSGLLSGRRAAVCLGALLAACIFLVMSDGSAQQLPAVLLSGVGRWGGSFSGPAFAPPPHAQPAIPSTVAEAQDALDKTLQARAGEIAAAANAASRGRVPVGGSGRSVHWVPVRSTVPLQDAQKRLEAYRAYHFPTSTFDDYVRSDDPTRDMDINNLYKHSEDALLNDLNQKLKEKVALEVAQQVKEKVPQMQSALIREQKMKQLVSDTTGQMVDVNHGFDQIQVMQAQGHEMFSKADEMEKEIRSPETKDLFDRAEAILLAMNATVNCTNGTNATNCTNATDAGDGGEQEVAAAEKVC